MDEVRGSSNELPEGLGELAPGVDLHVLLTGVDRGALGVEGLLEVLAARARLLWHLQAELSADLEQLVTAERRQSPQVDLEQAVSDIGTVAGWRLHCGTGFMQSQVEAAVALRRRLPMVWAAQMDGLIDAAKAVAFADGLSGLADDEQARVIAVRLLPKAVTWTLSELRAALRYHVDRADPDSARRRYHKGEVTRDVTLRANLDGTACLVGQGLAPHKAAAGFDRLDRIARAARADGDVRTLAQLRCDAMADILAGIPFQLHPTADPVTAAADAVSGSVNGIAAGGVRSRSSKGITGGTGSRSTNGVPVPGADCWSANGIPAIRADSRSTKRNPAAGAAAGVGSRSANGMPLDGASSLFTNRIPGGVGSGSGVADRQGKVCGGGVSGGGGGGRTQHGTAKSGITAVGSASSGDLRQPSDAPFGPAPGAAATTGRPDSTAGAGRGDRPGQPRPRRPVVGHRRRTRRHRR